MLGVNTCNLLKKINNNNNSDNYLDLARELKKLWNMQVTIIPIVIGDFGTVTKGLLKGLEELEVGGRVETIQITALLRTIRILRTVLETWGDLLSLKLQRKPISVSWCEKTIIIIIIPDLIVINNKKENLQNCRLCCPGWPQNKTKRKRKEG